jgi:hypothetical protein
MPRILLTSPIAALMLGLAAASPAQQSGTAGAAPADSATAEREVSAEVVAAARKELLARYVLPETAAQLDAALAAAQQEGAFAGLSHAPLAEAINRVLRSVTPDGHLGITYDPRTARVLAEQPSQDDEEEQDLPPEFIRQIDQANGGVHKLELMPGNIRYLDYRGFMWGAPAAEQALATAMEFLRRGDALIIDLRRNGGGSPQAVAAMASYFVEPGTPLMRFEMRGNPGQASATHAPPFSLAGKPLYVLTSRQSASAAEEFASHVAAFGFGRLVGDTTAGAGFRNTLVGLPEGFVISISVGRAVHALTGRDWERTGVAPAIAVPADRALAAAQAEAMAAIAAAAPEDERDNAQRLAAYYRAVAEPVDPGLPAVAYAGSYGPRTLAVDGQGHLVTRRGEQPPARLVAVGRDLFVPEAAPTQHFRFVREGGEVIALEVDGPGGLPQRAARGA